MICRTINLPLHQSSGEAKSNLFVNSNRGIIFLKANRKYLIQNSSSHNL